MKDSEKYMKEKKMKNKILAVFSAILVVMGGVFIVPTVAQAHTGDLFVTAQCNTETGQYDLTATLTTANTHHRGVTKWKVGTSQFQGTPTSDAYMENGPIDSVGSQTLTLGTFSLPGNTTGFGPWVYAFTTWADNFTQGSDGRLTTALAGDCVKPEPPFDGVEKYTPTYNVTCEAATFSHPAIKTGLGIANVYGIRYGATQAEAQAKDFEAYTPGTVVTYPFADPYISNSFYFEVKVGFDGVNLKQQIGQTRGVSEACEKPIPPKPEVIVGDEQRTSDPVCAIPADGTQVSYLENVVWTQDHEFDPVSWTWVALKRVYGDWTVVDTIVTKNEKCDPPKVIEEPKKETPKAESQEQLAVTGSELQGLYIVLGTVAGLMIVVGGISFVLTRIATRNVRK